jgi:hypothetical protein
VVVGEGTFAVGANDLVDIAHPIGSFGEEGCVNGRSPQCWYYLTFERAPVGGSTFVLMSSSEGVPLQTTRQDVLGYNCDGQCIDTQSPLAGFPAQRQNLQSTYTLTLTSNNTAWGNVQGSGTYQVGTRASAVAAPVFGNQFMRWEEGGATVSTDRAIQVLLSDSDRTLNAIFATGTPPLATAQRTRETPDGECTVGPVQFDPAGNQLFAFGNTWNGDTTLSWLVTDCYERKLEFTLGVRSVSLPAPIAFRSFTQTFDDAFYGGSYTSDQDLVEFTSNLTLNGAPCDPNLFPSCQYFFEATDVTSPDPLQHAILYSSREDILRSTAQDVLGFECNGACGTNIPASPLALSATPNLLQKNYDLTIEVFLNGNAAPTTSAGFVTGEGRYAFNSEVNVQAIPQPGYEFEEWIDEAGTTYPGERIFVTMNEDRNLQARFTSNTLRNVTVNIVGTGTGAVTGDGPQPAEATIELVAQPASGSRVAAWRTDGGEVIGRAGSLLISFVENDQGQLIARVNGISLPNLSPDGDIELELELEAFEQIGLAPANSGPTLSLVPCGDETKQDIDVDGDGVVDDASYCDYNFVILMISRIINFIFLLVLPIAGVIAVVTGVMILTSGGNPTQRQKAKNAFMKFFIGIIIVMVAWLLVATVLRTLGARSAYSLLDVVGL